MTADDKLFLKKLLPAAKHPICNAFAGSVPSKIRRRRPKTPPQGPSVNTSYPVARTFAPPPANLTPCAQTETTVHKNTKPKR